MPRHKRHKASKHRKKHYRTRCEVASNPDYQVQHDDSGINVVVGAEVISGPFSTDAEARSWIDRQMIDRRSAKWSGRKVTPITPDSAFWRAWRDNAKAMKSDGYRVGKTDDGKWKAWLEVRA